MHCVRKVVDDLYWVGANDRRLALFENVHPIPRGVSYNSYLLMDEKTVLLDTADWSVGRQFIENVEYVLNGRPLDYMIINHMEPDHCASMDEIILRHPEVTVISTERAFMLMRQFGYNVDDRMEEVKEGDTKCFGKHTLAFVAAPMVHWPEAIVSFDVTNGVLFAADAFGSFGALDGKLFNDEVNFDRDWIDDARRYFTNIVGKYGPQVQALLKKAGTIEIKTVCPLHGPVWRSDLGYFIEKYDKWSRYEPEEQGILVVYSSMYGNTEAAVQNFVARLAERGMLNVAVYDASNTHVSYLIAEAFKYSHIVLASATYNLGIFPTMHNFLIDMKALNLQKRTVGLIENGSWASKSGDLMQEILDEMKLMTVLNTRLSLTSALNENNDIEMEDFIDALLDSFNK